MSTLAFCLNSGTNYTAGSMLAFYNSCYPNGDSFIISSNSSADIAAAVEAHSEESYSKIMERSGISSALGYVAHNIDAILGADELDTASNYTNGEVCTFSSIEILMAAGLVACPKIAISLLVAGVAVEFISELITHHSYTDLLLSLSLQNLASAYVLYTVMYNPWAGLATVVTRVAVTETILEKIKCNTSLCKVLVASSKTSLEYAARSLVIEDAPIVEALIIGFYNGFGYNVSENVPLSPISATWVESGEETLKYGLRLLPSKFEGTMYLGIKRAFKSLAEWGPKVYFGASDKSLIMNVRDSFKTALQIILVPPSFDYVSGLASSNVYTDLPPLPVITYVGAENPKPLTFEERLKVLEAETADLKLLDFKEQLKALGMPDYSNEAWSFFARVAESGNALFDY